MDAADVWGSAVAAARFRTGEDYPLPLEIDFASAGDRTCGVHPLDVIADAIAWQLLVGLKTQSLAAEEAHTDEALAAWRKALEPETQVAVDRWLEIRLKERSRAEEWEKKADHAARERGRKTA